MLAQARFYHQFPGFCYNLYLAWAHISENQLKFIIDELSKKHSPIYNIDLKKFYVVPVTLLHHILNKYSLKNFLTNKYLKNSVSILIRLIKLLRQTERKKEESLITLNFLLPETLNLVLGPLDRSSYSVPDPDGLLWLIVYMILKGL
ncbi:hypothetical protein BpHYR1_006835 [Brachionus plicatilis]|uniref:Uncharacterized protein n=1 Tax=Brachionus plicatilis TaxID=10195 RepID=A0A3M7PHL1_BRAPC|nr:hypothetical protein BpHYR1_006835 [Brachionus plicatilis]